MKHLLAAHRYGARQGNGRPGTRSLKNELAARRPIGRRSDCHGSVVWPAAIFKLTFLKSHVIALALYLPRSGWKGNRFTYPSWCSQPAC